MLAPIMSLYSGGYTGDSSGNPEVPASIMDLENVFRLILNVVTRLAGIAVFIMLIAGAFMYLTAGGEKEKLAKATKTITFAVIGTALLIGSWFILRLLEQFTGLDLLTFSLFIDWSP
jgi:cytochrome bd-type quinol oxidase subunit 2